VTSAPQGLGLGWPRTLSRSNVPSIPVRPTGQGLGWPVAFPSETGNADDPLDGPPAVVPYMDAGRRVETAASVRTVQTVETVETVDAVDPAPSVSRETEPLPGPSPVSRETTTADSERRQQLVDTIPVAGADTPLAQTIAQDARRRISLSGRAFPKPAVPRVLTVANQKGGVGKTTTTVNIGAALAQAGLRVLIVDLDPQGNASTALGIDHHADVASIYDVLVDGKPLSDVVIPCATVDGLLCAPATIDLAGAEIELVSMVAREMRLGRAVQSYLAEADVDYVLIDCPPSLGLLTINAFVAASEVFIPIQCEYYALEGLSQLLKNIELIRSHLNPDLHVSTILLTMYDGRTRLSSQVADEVRAHFPDQVLRTSVPRSVRVSEAPSFGVTVMTYDPTSSGALSYLEAAGELADRGVVEKGGR